MSTAGDDHSELRIGGWLPPTDPPVTADETEVTEVIPAVRDRGRHSHSGPRPGSEVVLRDAGGAPVDEPRRPGRRAAVAVVVSVATVAIAAGVPLLISMSDQPDPPDQRVLPAPTAVTATAWPAPDSSPSARPTSRPSRPPASRGAVRAAERSTPPPATSAPPTARSDSLAGGATTTQSLEAESADLDGFASTRRVDSASGGQVVTRVGYRHGTLRFSGLTAPRAGDYDLVVYYVADDGRWAEIEVNGRSAGRFEFPSTGGRETVKTMTVRLPLAAGPNTVEFSNSDGWAPDFDRIALTS